MDENINVDGVVQDDEIHYDVLDNGEYESIYTVKNKCVISDYKKNCINNMIGTTNIETDRPIYDQIVQ
jgi:hypothetical protein